MKARSLVAAAALALAPLAAPPARGQQATARPHPAPAPRIVVDPDFLVSRDGDMPHVETIVAVNPKDPKNLVAGAITLASRAGSWGCKAYASHDGGRAWTPSALAEQVAHGGGDPQVAFTPNGTALFGCLAFVKDDTGTTRAALHVSRSEDGGLTWSRAADLGYSYDHPMFAVDQTAGRFAGRAYIGVLYGREYNIGVFRSADDGRTWTGPVRLHSGKTIGANVVPLVIFRDGALLVPIMDFPLDADPVHTTSPLTTWTALSNDGGVTFTAPRRIHTTKYRMAASERVILLGTPAFAADPSDLHADRLYTAWNDFGPAGRANPRIYVRHSDDRGRTWSKPVAVDPATPANASQFNVAIAVNKDGIVGVSWYDTRTAGDTLAWHQHFAASADGGSTFLPSVRVSSELSSPFGVGNLTVVPSVYTRTNRPQVLSFLSAASRWGSGGDYAGLAADRDGVFHPLWADSRSGTFQAWTARVRVERPPARSLAGPAGAAASPAAQSSAAAPDTSRAPTDVTSRLEIVADPSHYDPTNHELEVNLRLRNVSDRPVRGPVTVTVQAIGTPAEWQPAETERAREREQAPTILNASNSKPQDGAAMDYSAALGGTGVLLPGMQSGPVRWRFKVKDPVRIPDLQLVITGVVDPER